MVPTVWYWHTLGLHRNLDHKVWACCWPIRVTILQLGGLAMHPKIHFDPQPLAKVIQTVRNTLPQGPCFLTQCEDSIPFVAVEMVNPCTLPQPKDTIKDSTRCTSQLDPSAVQNRTCHCLAQPNPRDIQRTQ